MSTHVRSSIYFFIYLQDTVVALQALAKFASLTYSTDVSMTISTETSSKNLPPFVLNANNKDTVQFIDVSNMVRLLYLSHLPKCNIYASIHIYKVRLTTLCIQAAYTRGYWEDMQACLSIHWLHM